MIEEEEKANVIVNITECEQSISVTDLEPLIKNIRGLQVMLDSDLARLYGVETRR